MKFAYAMSTRPGRLLRAVAGTALLIVAVALAGGSAIAGAVAAVLGLVLALGGALDVCPLAPVLRTPFSGTEIRRAAGS